MTPEDAEDFFLEWGLHISDGVDSCSGTDYKETERAAQRLSSLVARAVAEEREACIVDASYCRRPDDLAGNLTIGRVIEKLRARSTSPEQGKAIKEGAR